MDILLISETKLDNSFPNGYFLIKGYSTSYRLDRDAQGVGIMLFTREDISSKRLAIKDSPTEEFYVELNSRKKKWLLCCSYNPKKSNFRAHLECFNKSLALYLLKCEYFVSSIFKRHRAHFPDQARKNKKNAPRKKFLIFQEMEKNFFLILKKKLYFLKRKLFSYFLERKLFLYFLKRKLLLYFRKWNPALFSPSSKN